MSETAFEIFLEKWVHPDYRPAPVRAEELDSVEVRFETLLPLAYRRFMDVVGPVSTGASLSMAIIAQKLGIPTVQEFLTPSAIVKTTEAYRAAGLPSAFLAFAVEGSGDLYCFEVAPDTGAVPEDVLVWYFDHEERELECLEVPFSRWVYAYSQVARVET